MPRSEDEGLRSDALRTALIEALAGRRARLEDLLSRHGAAQVSRPNLKLAAAFGAEIGTHPGPAAAALLTALGDDIAAPDTARVFLPMAASHGWAGRIRAGRDLEAAWTALAALAADERAPVRVACLDALLGLSARDGGADSLIARAGQWLEAEDRELRFGAAALVVEVIGEARVLSHVREIDALAAYVSRVIADVAAAPRTAERLDARRRLLQALPRALVAVAGNARAGQAGARWFEAECLQAEHPDVRLACSTALGRLSSAAHGLKAAVLESLRRSLASTGKPPRDPTRIRPGTGRGKASRRIR